MKFDPKKKIVVMAMSAALMAGPITPALAATFAPPSAGGTNPANNPLISKTWNPAPQMSHRLSSVTFNVGAATYTAPGNSTTSPSAGAVTDESGNPFTGKTVTMDYVAGTDWGTKTAQEVFGDLNFSRPGTYDFVVTENGTDNKLVDYNVNNSSYVVRVTAVWSDEARSSVNVIGATVHENNGGNAGNKIADPDNRGGMFVNRALDDASLTATKQVAGNQADENEQFPFTVALSNLEPNATYTYTDANGASQTATSDASGNLSVSASLKHGQSIAFTDLSAGAAYSITEGGVDLGNISADTRVNGYTPSIAGADWDLSEAGTKNDSVTVTNTKSTATVTGLMVTYLPYIGGLAAAGVGAGALVISRRRNKAHDQF